MLSPGTLSSSGSPDTDFTVTRIRHDAPEWAQRQDLLAEETPIALQYNGISHATLLASPADLEDFALGFSLTEGIVARPDQIRNIEIHPQPAGIVIELDIASACVFRLKERRRAMAGRTGCGLCGVETLPEVLRPVPAVIRGDTISVAAVLAAMRGMRAAQVLHDRTGATHAAAWMDTAGSLGLVREDVGRHNALDKLLGALARSGTDFSHGAVLVSSRASFEMVQKTAAMGAGVLAAVSAPTALAVRLAREMNISLIGFARGEDASIYAHASQLAP